MHSKPCVSEKIWNRIAIFDKIRLYIAACLGYTRTEGVIDIKKKKITMQDIADIVGISKAAVSYVLNNKPNSRISEETRNKVLHIANLYNYSPNIIAKSLSSDLENPIGIVNGTGIDDCWLFAQEQTALIHEITDKLKSIERNVMLFHPSYTSCFPVEAIIGINLSSEEIMNLSQKVFVPLLLVDSYIGDPLFYQFNFDYMHVLREAGHIFGENGFSCVFGPYRNEALQKFLSRNIDESNMIFSKDPSSLKTYIAERRSAGKKLVFFNCAAALLAREMLAPQDYIVVTSDTIADLFFPGVITFAYSVHKAASAITDLLIQLSMRNEDALPVEHLQKIPVYCASAARESRQ
jgi:DNA-binding LacI/PurR family transcriptional regulator